MYLHYCKNFGLKKYLFYLQPFMSLSLPSWELISSFNQRIRLLHVSMWLTKLMMAKTFLFQDLQAGTFLTKDYKEIITSNDVLSEVIKDEKLNMTEAELAKMISVNIPTDTRLISISVNAKTGQDAQTLANKVREVASEKIKNVTKVEDVTTLEEAKLPESPSSPNIKRNVLLGAVLGGFLAVVGVLVREILDDRIRRPEDVEDALGMTLLGIVPDTDKI